jgi:hypothetical protein
MMEGSKMVIERSVVVALPVQKTIPACVPTAYRVVIRIDDRRDCEAVALLVQKAFGQIQMASRIGSRISGRVWLEIGPYSREIAEARAEVVRRNARLDRRELSIHIRKVAP